MLMRIIPLMILTIIFLSGCSHKKFDTNLQSLNGQNIDVAMNYLGIPDDKFTIDDKEVYVWGNEQIVTTNQSPITTYGGYNSRGGAFGGVGIVFGTPNPRNVNSYYCKIKVITDKNQIIEKIERDSTAGACSKYSDALESIDQDNSDF